MVVTWRTVACAALLLSFSPWGAAAGSGGLFSADAGSVPLRRPVRDLFDHGAHAHPEAVPPRGTFSELPGAAELRFRAARIDLERLSAVQLDIDEGRSARLNLNLFADAEFDAVMERTEPTASGYTLTGRLAGVPMSTVVLAVNGDAMAGKVWSRGTVYTIRSTGGGAVIREVDPSGLPRCEGPLTPPAVFERSIGAADLNVATGNGFSAGMPSGATVPPAVTFPAADPSIPADDGSVIDLLVVYPPFVRRAEGGLASMRALIDRDVAAVNEAYRAGGVVQRVQLVAATEVDYGITEGMVNALQSLARNSDGDMDEVHALRDSYAADLVLLHVGEERATPSRIGGGIAVLLFSRSSEHAAPWAAFSLSSSWSFAHELGHNMGLGHQWADEPRSELLYPYGRGYEVRGQSRENDPRSWYTIMHTAGSGRINRFSNPNQRYPDESGVLLGVPGDNWPETDDPQVEGPANAVRALNNTRRIVANFRASADRCDYALSPRPSELPAEGGKFKVRVVAAPNCPWTARTYDGFVSVEKEGTSGVGYGEITYRVQRNEGWDREAALLVAGEVYPLKQVGERVLTPVCERTAEVAQSISDATNKLCEEVTAADLAAIGVLPVSEILTYPKLPVTVLKPGDFDGLSNLTILRILMTKDLTLVPGLFDGLSNLRILEVSGTDRFFGNYTVALPLGAFRGLDKLDELWLNLHPDTSVTVAPGVFKELYNLRDLDIWGSFTSLRPGVFAGLSNLVYLRVQPEVMVLRTGVFQGLANLRALSLENGSLVRIDPGAFAGLRKLESLHLQNNQLATLESGTFEGLPSLVWLFLEDNRLKTLGSGVFSGLNRLVWLRLLRNGLKTIEQGAFAGLQNLRSLNLWHNQLSILDPGIFEGLPSMSFLDLEDNRLKTIKSGAFYGLRSLLYLYLGGNRLTTLPPDLLHGLFSPEETGETAKLEILHLENNSLTHLSPNLLRKPADAGADGGLSYGTTDGRFWRLTNLASLHLSGNRLTELPADMFRSAPFLAGFGGQHRALDLTGNPGAPFVLPLELVRLPSADSAVGRPLQVTVKIANGAPFNLDVRLSASGGSLSRSEMRIVRGENQGVPLSVTPNGEGSVAVRLEAADWAGRSGVTHPEFPGLEIVSQRSPLVLYGYADAKLELGGVAVLDLPSVFSYFVGDATYAVESSDPTTAAADVEGNAFRVKANAAGTATVTVTATGRDGRRMERRFEVTVETPLGSRWGGWRSVLLQPKPSAEDGNGTLEQ